MVWNDRQVPDLSGTKVTEELFLQFRKQYGMAYRGRYQRIIKKCGIREIRKKGARRAAFSHRGMDEGKRLYRAPSFEIGKGQAL